MSNGVKPETICLAHQKQSPKVSLIECRRWLNGYWTAEYKICFSVQLNDGRVIKFKGRQSISGRQFGAKRGRPSKAGAEPK